MNGLAKYNDTSWTVYTKDKFRITGEFKSYAIAYRRPRKMDWNI